MPEREVNALLFSTREIDVLRLLRWCRYISRNDLLTLFSDEDIQPLLLFRFITLYRKHDAFVLTEAGNRFLNDHLPELPPAVRPSYKEEDFIRRSRVSRFVLTAYRAGVDLFHTKLSALEHNGACYLTAQARTKGTNPWGSTRVAALLRLGNMICGAHYVESSIGRIAFADEMNALNNNTAHLGGVERALIYTGESYDSILAALSETEDEAQSKLRTYGDVFLKGVVKIFIIPANETGARQLSMMARPDYRVNMTKIALGPLYEPPPKERSEWDAMYKGVPFIMAADMDLQRLDTAAESSIKNGHGPICIVALKGQEEVLKRRYKTTGLARKIFTFSREKPEVLQALSLYTPSDRQFETTKGDVIHAPPLQADRKAGRPNRK